MIFSEPVFIFGFLPAALALHVLARRFLRQRAHLGVLIGVSLVYYCWWHVEYAGLLLGSVAVNYLAGLVIARLRSRAVLWTTIFANLGCIAFFKYTGFFAPGVARELVLPLAISFFTFQQIAYLVDVYRSGAPETSAWRYGFFVMFFPQLVAGPIVHHREIRDQLDVGAEKNLSLEDLRAGATLFLIGLTKKLVIADSLSPVSDSIFGASEIGTTLPPGLAWIGAAAFTFQIYFDFSGYTDMALGIGRFFGFRLPVNFDSPYRSTSIIEFWRRWHITLSRFLRDYLYIPLGGNRHGFGRQVGNIMITMGLGGLWHGAGWTFVLWGAAHGLLIVVNHLATRGRSSAAGGVPPAAGRPIRLAGWAATSVAVILLWVLFRSSSLDGALHYYGAMFTPANGGPSIAHFLAGALRNHHVWGGFIEGTGGGSPALVIGVTAGLVMLGIVVTHLPTAQVIAARRLDGLAIAHLVVLAALGMWFLDSLMKSKSVVEPFIYFQF